MSALLAEMNGLTCDNLELADRSDEKQIIEWRRTMKRDWGIETKQELLDMLVWLRNDGHNESYRRMSQYWNRFSEPQFMHELRRVQDEKLQRQIWLCYLHRSVLRRVGIAAWDYGRHVYLCRWGYYTDLLTETETWEQIEPVANDAQKIFDSWEQYGISYVVGRLYWIGGSIAESVCEGFFGQLNAMLRSENGAWQRLGWHL
ncbi:MAG: DUF1266 domain-containing protein [Gammaproteobacteria bacterium]|nr:DUF1266 domain-containing protein [Gammaproteobacteria bacterium]